jgi:hypothetical protein
LKEGFPLFFLFFEERSLFQPRNTSGTVRMDNG